ncbi:hypothetical protein [Peribacillus simplex]|uniref:hypothetical protein n=1 Tax=Peribacillus simplex TaxID=1478 RepID=UPI003D9C1619
MAAGETIESAIKKSQTLNEKGMVCTMDHLGEPVTVRNQYGTAMQNAGRNLSSVNCILIRKMSSKSVLCLFSSEILRLTLNITELVKSPVQNDGGHYFDNNKRFFYYAFTK